ncbi:MAG TPA: hypothetical protein ENK91_10615 [Bacteroidetes bacterium]|nr:hypothetical protein [Bacteroidota bacterium]
MKTIYSFLIILFLSKFISAQVVEKQMNISLGLQPCLTTTVEGIDNKEVAKLWKKFFKEYGKVKKNSKAREYYSTAVRVNRIKSGDPIDVYAKFDEFGADTKISLCFDLGTAFLSKDEFPEEYYGGEEFVNEFKVYVQKYIVGNKLKEEEKKLDKLDKELKNTVKSNKKLHDKIAMYKDKIKKAESEIELNLQKQDQLKKQMEEQSDKVRDVQAELNSMGK